MIYNFIYQTFFVSDLFLLHFFFTKYIFFQQFNYNSIIYCIQNQIWGKKKQRVVIYIRKEVYQKYVLNFYHQMKFIICSKYGSLLAIILQHLNQRLFFNSQSSFRFYNVTPLLPLPTNYCLLHLLPLAGHPPPSTLTSLHASVASCNPLPPRLKEINFTTQSFNTRLHVLTSLNNVQPRKKNCKLHPDVENKGEIF